MSSDHSKKKYPYICGESNISRLIKHKYQDHFIHKKIKKPIIKL